MKNSSTMGNELIKILGKESNDPLVFDILSHWGLSQERIQIMLKRDACVCGGREDSHNETHILVYGRKKINKIEFWTNDKTKKKEMELPFGFSRFESKEKIDDLNGLIEDEDKFYSFYLERDKETFIKRASVSEITKGKYNKLLKERQGGEDEQESTNSAEIISKLSSKKLQDFATYILEDDKKYDLIDSIRLVVDWRESDKEIITDCETILKTNHLKAELVDVEISKENSEGWELYIYYKDKKNRVDYGSQVRRWKTINTLNQVISYTYQLRLLLSSLDSDTHELICLSHQEWQELEKVLGKDKVAEVVEFMDNEFF